MIEDLHPPSRNVRQATDPSAPWEFSNSDEGRVMEMTGEEFAQALCEHTQEVRISDFRMIFVLLFV